LQELRARKGEDFIRRNLSELLGRKNNNHFLISTSKSCRLISTSEVRVHMVTPKVSKSKKAAATKNKKHALRFIIDCGKPVADDIVDPAQYETFLRERIKVKGKAGNLGSLVKIQREKSKIYVIAQPPFSKRYLKYLTKKFLKKQRLRDWLRVVAKDKATYELRYFNIHEAEEALAEDEEEETAKK
jgi:large subunit ribosomal protein L22e